MKELNMNKGIIVLAFIILSFLPSYAIEDFMLQNLEGKKITSPDTNLDYDYTSTLSIPITLKAQEKLSTRKKYNLYENKKVNFIVQNDVAYDGKLLVQKGTVIDAKVKCIISSGMNGIPYSIIIDDFNIPNIPSSKLKSEYKKDGWNRTYIVLPLKWALTFLPPTGSLTNFIKGGHATITKKDKIILEYYPLWGKNAGVKTPA